MTLLDLNGSGWHERPRLPTSANDELADAMRPDVEFLIE
jgi:hypothetical protein